MNESDLIVKLDEIQECKNKVVEYFRQNLDKINEIIISSLMPGENLIGAQPFFGQNNFNQVFWNYFGEEKKVIFIKNAKMYDVSDSKNSIYIGFFPYTNKIEFANDELIIEYVNCVISEKEEIINKLENKINYLKNNSIELEKFINIIKEKLA
jgi:hypothetical protein